MTQHNQPADTRVNRANFYRRIGRLSFQSGDQPGLPAPKEVSFYDKGGVWLSFDSFEEAYVWAERYGLDLSSEQDYHSEQTDSLLHLGSWYGEIEGVPVTVKGSTPVDQTAPADTDPDDLSDEAPRGTDDSEEHAPKPADVEGHSHARGTNGFVAEEAEG